jgi:RNA-directed DNA polymerase
VVGRWLRRVVQGCFNHHAVAGNVNRLNTFRKEVSRAWLHALGRRGQRERIPWSWFGRLVERYLLRLGCSTRIRINASRHDSRQEPYA